MHRIRSSMSLMRIGTSTYLRIVRSARQRWTFNLDLMTRRYRLFPQRSWCRLMGEERIHRPMCFCTEANRWTRPRSVGCCFIWPDSWTDSRMKLVTEKLTGAVLSSRYIFLLHWPSVSSTLNRGELLFFSSWSLLLQFWHLLHSTHEAVGKIDMSSDTFQASIEYDNILIVLTPSKRASVCFPTNTFKTYFS